MPFEKRESPPDRSWREVRHILRREIPFFNISGAKPHVNALKETFSTDPKSDCIRSGLKRGKCVSIAEGDEVDKAGGSTGNSSYVMDSETLYLRKLERKNSRLLQRIPGKEPANPIINIFLRPVGVSSAEGGRGEKRVCLRSLLFTPLRLSTAPLRSQC